MRAGWESQSGRRGESSDSLEDPETQSQCREKGCCPFAAALLSSSSAQRATGSSPRRTRRNPAALTTQRAFLSVYFWKSHPASPSGATRLSSWSGRALSMEAASRDPRIRQPYESTRGVRSLPRALPRLVARDGGVRPEGGNTVLCSVLRAPREDEGEEHSEYRGRRVRVSTAKHVSLGR